MSLGTVHAITLDTVECVCTLRYVMKARQILKDEIWRLEERINNTEDRDGQLRLNLTTMQTDRNILDMVIQRLFSVCPPHRRL